MTKFKLDWGCAGVPQILYVNSTPPDLYLDFRGLTFKASEREKKGKKAEERAKEERRRGRV